MSIVHPMSSRKIAISMRAQQGFSMIEILVSVVISAIALLGLAGLQISSVNTSTTAYAHSQSMIVIAEIIDQMRSNVAAAKAGDFDITLTSGNEMKSFSDMGSTPGTDTTQIESIKYYWFQNLDRTLPDARAALKCTASGTCAIKVQYLNPDRDRASSDTLLEQIISVQL